MPHLTSYETIKVVFPSTKDLPEDQRAWVEMRTEVLVEDLVSTNQVVSTGTFLDTVGTITRMIVEWNFTKEDGTPEDITEENVRRFKVSDFTALTESLTAKVLSVEEKKSLSSTSQQAKTETTTD